MKLKSILSIVVKYVVLSVIWLVVFIVSMGIALPSSAQQPTTPEQESATILALLVVGLLNTAVVVYIILRSRWSGWKLSAAIFLLHYVSMTFMSMIETLPFPAVLDRMPPGTLQGTLVGGLLLALVFAPLSVLILGKWKQREAADEANMRLIGMPAGEWAWKLVVIAVVYVTLYFTFGYYIAWQNPELVAYYGGTDPGSFFAQMRNVMDETPWLPLFQVLRAMLWTLIALPVIRFMKGRTWETGLAVGLSYAVLMNSQHLVPNPIMPDVVRMAHMVETASSNFIFGLVVTALLLWRPKRAK